MSAVSFGEAVFTVRVVNEASREFENISRSSRSMTSEIRYVAREIAAFGASAFAIARVGEQFGFLTKQQADWLASAGSVLSLGANLVRLLSYLASAETAATIAKWAHTAAQWASNIAQAFALALGGQYHLVLLAIAAAAITAAVAIGYMASQQRGLNEQLRRSPVEVQRENEQMQRRRRDMH